MKKILFFVLTALTFAACEQALVEEQSAICPDVPETITVGFEGEDTRIQLNEAQKTVWTSGDLVSVFYRSDANQKWQYTGETGARTADLTCVDAGEATATMNRVVVVYPYSGNYYINTETYNIQAFLPAVQTYLKDSYGLDGNIMISSSEYNQFSLKSVCGWLKLQLTGNGEKIKSITLKGNNGEQVAGELYINSADATVTLSSDTGSTDDGETGGAGGGLVFEDTILKEVTLDCGEGIELGTEATAFYIALPPQTYTEGITVDITTINGLDMTQSTDKEVVIERNHIQPMTAFTADFHIPETWKIYYTATQKVEPYDKTVFGATYLSNVWDSETGEGVITFDDDVTTIGREAFYNCDSLASVNIPDSVTTIGNKAFHVCTSLASVNIPDSVTTIGNYAFSFCNSMINVNIPDSVTTIGSWAFSNCYSLTSVNIPDSVTSIGQSAFTGCDSLASVNISDNVKTIGSQTFMGCSSLTSVNIPDSVTTIGKEAFYNCDSLASVNIPDRVKTIGDYAFYSCNSLISVYCKATTPPTLGGIWVFDYNGDGRGIYVPAGSVNAYKSATNWREYKSAIVGYDFENGQIAKVPSNNEIWYTSDYGEVVTPYNYDSFDANIISNTYENGKGVITFDGDVTTIGYQAFYKCDGLSSVYIPDSVTLIAWHAFNSCTSLRSVTIPDSVTEIGESAFWGCTSLTSVNIPDSVIEILSNAFQNCTSLRSVTIGDRVKWIGGATFYNCTSLTSVNIPDSVTTIGDIAFHNCTSLRSVTIGDSVTEIGDSAFYNCTSLTSVYCKATTPPRLGDDLVFDGNGSGRKIYVPTGSVNAYKNISSRWSEYASSIVGYKF